MSTELKARLAASWIESALIAAEYAGADANRDCVYASLTPHLAQEIADWYASAPTSNSARVDTRFSILLSDKGERLGRLIDRVGGEPVTGYDAAPKSAELEIPLNQGAPAAFRHSGEWLQEMSDRLRRLTQRGSSVNPASYAVFASSSDGVQWRVTAFVSVKFSPRGDWKREAGRIRDVLLKRLHSVKGFGDLDLLVRVHGAMRATMAGAQARLASTVHCSLACVAERDDAGGERGVVGPGHGFFSAADQSLRPSLHAIDDVDMRAPIATLTDPTRDLQFSPKIGDANDCDAGFARFLNDGASFPTSDFVRGLKIVAVGAMARDGVYLIPRGRGEFERCRVVGDLASASAGNGLGGVFSYVRVTVIEGASEPPPPLAEPGDSGLPVLAPVDGGYALVGMIVAGTETTSASRNHQALAVPASVIFERLQLRLPVDPNAADQAPTTKPEPGDDAPNAGDVRAGRAGGGAEGPPAPSAALDEAARSEGHVLRRLSSRQLIAPKMRSIPAYGASRRSGAKVRPMPNAATRKRLERIQREAVAHVRAAGGVVSYARAVQTDDAETTIVVSLDAPKPAGLEATFDVDGVRVDVTSPPRRSISDLGSGRIRVAR